VREEVGAVLYVPVVRGFVVLPFGHLVEGILLDDLAFVGGYLVVSILKEEAHQRAISNEGDDSIGLVVSELQTSDPYEDDEDGDSDQLVPKTL